MDEEEIQKYLKIALDSGVSSYYRKDAIRHLGRLRKSAELSQAVIKLLRDLDDPSLQREAMDLTAQFAISEAVNLILPISVGNGMNARHAINVLAKIGGVKAYNCLKEIADTPGFDLSKTAAKRAIEDLLRREPNLAEENAEDPSVFDTAKSLVSDVKQNFVPEKDEQAPVSKPEVKKPDPKKENCPQDLGRVQRELRELQNKNSTLQRELDEKTSRVEELEDKLRKLKGSSETANQIRDLKKQVHESHNETASVKAAYEKQVVLLQSKINSLEEENEDLLKRSRNKLTHKPASKGGAGCFTFLIFLGIFIYIAYFIFSQVTSSQDTFDDIRKKIHLEQR